MVCDDGVCGGVAGVGNGLYCTVVGTDAGEGGCPGCVVSGDGGAGGGVAGCPGCVVSGDGVVGGGGSGRALNKEGGGLASHLARLGVAVAVAVVVGVALGGGAGGKGG